jgi:hypothetical protein
LVQFRLRRTLPAYHQQSARSVVETVTAVAARGRTVGVLEDPVGVGEADEVVEAGLG